jgi:hypothetical protein
MLISRRRPMILLAAPDAVKARWRGGRRWRFGWVALPLLLALFITQLLVVTHGYRHPSPLPAHDCALCVVAGGLHWFAATASVALPTLAAAMVPPATAVPPAPTFSFFAAYLSRAPPVALN